MSDQMIQAPEPLKSMVRTNDHPKQGEDPAAAPNSSFSFDPAMSRICIELLTRATLYAGVIGLVVGLAAALLFPE